MSAWTPSSWRQKPAKHLPDDYPDTEKLAAVEAELASRPPLVFPGEVRRLRAELARAAAGEAFLLQGGDCAESFAEFTPDNVRDTFRVLMQMSMVLAFAASKPVIKVGRIAGQFAKPRSSPTETVDGVTLPSYRGDAVNATEFTPEARIPDPARLLRAYDQSASTLNLIRAYTTGGYADIENVRSWALPFAANSPQGEKYADVADRIAEAVDFMRVMGAAANAEALSRIEFYTSHEALFLNYEEALTRRDPGTGAWCDVSAHMIWIGDRSRQPDGAHVEFCRGVENPIGMKCGPTMHEDDLIRLIDLIDPNNEAGRMVLIARFGADKVAEHLPRLMRKVRAEGRRVVWSCDPMHGNTFTSESGFKTRAVDKILAELQAFLQIAHSEGVPPGGVHFEMTGQNVTECIGGPGSVKDADLGSRYLTHCDPRLNADQALELAFLIADTLKQGNRQGRIAAE